MQVTFMPRGASTVNVPRSSLRQDIYVSLTTRQPLRTNLQNFDESDVFQRNDDFAWSSRMVFLLAKTLQSTFGNPSASYAMGNEVEKWYVSKPHTFEPVKRVPQGPFRDQRFPTIWMFLPVHGRCIHPPL